MRIQHHDFGMEYEDKGTGTPLLLIHGYPLNRTLWDAQVNGLSDTARVIAPDLRGHGKSDPARGTYTMDLLADDLNELLNGMGVKQPVVVCGFSMGGYVAFAFYRKYPARVKGLIFAATKAGADSPEGKAGRDKSAALAQEKGAGAIAEAMLPKMLAPNTYTAHPEVVARLKAMMESTPVAGIVGDLMGMRDRADSTPTLATINVPTLVIHGADDQLIPSKEADATHAGIKNSKLVLIPGAGHTLVLEQPDAFNKAVREFLKGM